MAFEQMVFKSFMSQALIEAQSAADRGEVPVGAVIVDKAGQIVASAGNRTRELNDPTAHAEVLAIRAACAALGAERLNGCDLYVTLEPCPMCAAAISNARIARLYYGASDPKSGGVEQGARVFSHAQCHHAPEVYDGIDAAPAQVLLREFFKGRR
jgi:cytidine deaminase